MWVKVQREKTSIKQFSDGAFVLFQQVQSAESDLDSQSKLVLTLQDSLDAARKGHESEKEVN